MTMFQQLTLVFILFCLGFFQQTLVVAASLYKKDLTTADILNFRGAVLVKNGLETTCEFALIDNRAAFAPASCFDFSNGQLDTSTTYEIYFDQSKGYTPSKTSITKIHIHPSFDINSLANDVAIVEYNFTDQGNWVNYIAVYSEEWITTLYVSRVLSDASKQSWSLPYFKELNINALNCSAVSPLFANNPMDMRCHDLQKNGPWAKDCPLPYGAIYGVLSDTMAIAGLHSFTFMAASNYCTGARGLYYYTLLMHYIEWGESIIGRQISQLVEDTNGFAGVAQSPSYSMAGANPFNPAGKYLFTSDIRTPKLWNPNAAISNSAAPNSSSTASQPQTTSPSNSSIGSDNNGSIGSSSSNSGTGNNNSSSGNNDDGGDDSDNEESIVGIISNSVNFINPADHTSLFSNPPDNSDFNFLESATNSEIVSTGFEKPNHDTAEGIKQNGLSNTATIAIAISIPAAFIILAIIGFVLYRNCKRGSRADGKWMNAYFRRESNIRDIVGEIGGASDQDLPNYDELDYSARSSTFGITRPPHMYLGSRFSVDKADF